MNMNLFLRNVSSFIIFWIGPVFLILLIGYIYYDPFKVVRKYASYSQPQITSSRDYISTEFFLNNYKKYGYNSFVFGSSRSNVFKAKPWLQYIGQDEKPYFCDASQETIYGIYIKLRLLEKLHVKIKNCIILLCRDVSFANDQNDKGHIFIKHPEASLESYTTFQLEFFKSYLNPKFLHAFYAFQILKQYKPYMSEYFIGRTITYDSVTNELNILGLDEAIQKDPIAYYKDESLKFYERKGETTDSVSRINPEMEFMIHEIKRILTANRTRYKIILSPLYEQIKFHDQDLKILQSNFGKEVYDFTGKNKFTEEKINFYEKSHFRKHIADSLLAIIYK